MSHESTNHEEYLESILRLASPTKDPLCASVTLADLSEVRPSDIADYMGVTRPSVTAALDRMEASAFIERRHKKIHFTEEGFELAYGVLKRHRVAEEFLVKVLGFDEASVHDEACELEHAISDRMLAGLEKLIKDAK